MRSKMLTSMDTVLETANDPEMVDKALKASATVTANSDQMPLDNQVGRPFFFFVEFSQIINLNLQEKGAGIIEKVGGKMKEMESVDDNTVTDLATCLFFLLVVELN